jgi:hypothetical protein
VHHLLARAGRPGYPNASQGAEDAADAFADSALDHLTQWWIRWRLPGDCRSDHTHRILAVAEDGGLVFDDGLPNDPDLSAGPGLRTVRFFWTAVSDHPGWMVLGAARDEATFWASTADSDEVFRLDRPAHFVSAYFLTDSDGSGDLRTA